MFQINDLKIGIINTDIVKDMCSNLSLKNVEETKIDLALKGILQQ